MLLILFVGEMRNHVIGVGATGDTVNKKYAHRAKGTDRYDRSLSSIELRAAPTG